MHTSGDVLCPIPLRLENSRKILMTRSDHSDRPSAVVDYYLLAVQFALSGVQ